MVGQFGGPHEVVGTRDWMDGTNKHFSHDLCYPLPSHGDTPVVSAVVNHEQLENDQIML